MNIKPVEKITLTHERMLQLATGRSRFEREWKNSVTPLSELITRLSCPVRTGETLAEYLALSKSEQDKRKDVGGYVTGLLAEGRRAARTVSKLSAVTLDGDFAAADLLTKLRGLAHGWVAHTTRKHREEAPRWRVVFPLSRTVTPDEKEAIGRKLAEQLGIDQFDDSTYEPARLMYWPSCSQDSAFDCQYQDAPALDPDTVLALYDDWRDASRWPVSSRQRRAVERVRDKAGDPRAKPGMIGRFCTAYDIHAAIGQLLGGVYAPLGNGRYTYIEGSSSGGLVTYDALWAYSHHGTDPCSGMLCNAWDLVRIHKFGDLDGTLIEDTPVSRLPSTEAMVEFAQGLSGVRKAAAEEFTKFEVAPGESDSADPEAWTSQLTTNRRGVLDSTRENYRLIIEHTLPGVARDLFAQRVVVTEQPPWRAAWKGDNPGLWTDGDDAGLMLYLERRNMQPNKAMVMDALELVSRGRGFHPVRDYLAGLEWDGVGRLDTLLVDTMGAEDSEYTRAVSRKTLTGAVARVMEPGIKFDTALLLKGGQGIGKSLLVHVLGGQYASDSLFSLGSKDSFEAIQGVWIVEMAELSAARGAASTEAVKHYISKTHDRYRPAYGRHVAEFPRQCIFIGSTNDATPVSDSTGNRRFWIVECRAKGRRADWYDYLVASRDQLWAEAKHRYFSGEVLYLTGGLLDEAARIQEANRADDGMLGSIEAWLDTPVPSNWYSRPRANRVRSGRSEFESDAQTTWRDRVCALEVHCELLDGAPDRFNRAASRNINDALAKLGWPSGVINFGPAYGKQRGYKRPSAGRIEDDTPF